MHITETRLMYEARKSNVWTQCRVRKIPMQPIRLTLSALKVINSGVTIATPLPI
jgi:hypothetical protein